MRSPGQNEELSYYFNYENAKDEIRMKYVFDPNPSYTVNNKKAELLIKQIGFIPQIVVGNSKGDAALLNYCLHGSLCPDEKKIKPVVALLSQDIAELEPFYNNIQNDTNFECAKKYDFDTISTSRDFEELFEQ